MHPNFIISPSVFNIQINKIIFYNFLWFHILDVKIGLIEKRILSWEAVLVNLVAGAATTCQQRKLISLAVVCVRLSDGSEGPEFPSELPLI